MEYTLERLSGYPSGGDKNLCWKGNFTHGRCYCRGTVVAADVSCVALGCIKCDRTWSVKLISLPDDAALGADEDAIPFVFHGESIQEIIRSIEDQRMGPQEPGYCILDYSTIYADHAPCCGPHADYFAGDENAVLRWCDRGAALMELREADAYANAHGVLQRWA